MSNKPPDGKDGLLELLKKLWFPIAGFIGAVTLVYNFYKMWLGDQTTITYITAGVGLFVLVITLGWVGFSKRTVADKKKHRKELRYSPAHRRIAMASLSLILIGIGISSWFLSKHWQELNNKLIVVIASFEGPEDVYGLRNEIIEELNADFSNDQMIEIMSVGDVVTPDQGSPSARSLGKRYLADIVIWGWYRPTEDPNITIHIENLAERQLSLLGTSTTYKPKNTTVADLQSFAFQRQLGQETSILIAFLAGLIEIQTKDYDSAIARFNMAFESLKGETPFLDNPSDSYFIGLLLPEAYTNRGNAHTKSGQYYKAIADYDEAIKINPDLAAAYFGLGMAHNALGQHELAIEDYGKAIDKDPHLFSAYKERAISYQRLGKTAEAEADFKKYEELTGQQP